MISNISIFGANSTDDKLRRGMGINYQIEKVPQFILFIRNN